MRTPLFLLMAAALAPAAAWAGPNGVVPIPDAIKSINDQLSPVRAQNLQALAIRAKRDERMMLAMQSGDLQREVDNYIRGFHQGVVNRLLEQQSELQQQGKPPVVSRDEVDNYGKAFGRDLAALRKSINKEADDARARSIQDIPAKEWRDVISETAEERNAVRAMADKDHPGPIAALATVIDARLNKRAGDGGGQKPDDDGGHKPDDGGGGGGGHKPDSGSHGNGGASQNGGGGGAAGDASDRAALGDYNGAGKVLDKAVQDGGADAAAYAKRAGMAMDESRFQDAVSDSRRALAMDPRNADANAILHFAEGRIGGAGASAGAASAAAGGASALGSSGPGDMGASPAAAGLAAPAARPGSEQARAEALNALRLGDSSAALETLNRALAQDPGNPALLNMRAGVYASRREWARAIADAKAGLALAPRDPSLLRTLAYAQLRSGGYKDALASSSALIAADPKNPWGYAIRAHAEGDLGDRDAMLADARRAAALDPRFAGIAQAAGRLQLPSDSDVLFLFPGESDAKAPAAAAVPAPRARRFGLVVGVAALGGLLLALGLLQTVLAPLKEKAASAFTRLTRTGPSVAPVAADAPWAGRLPGLVRGQYEISRQIGAGGMGMVYEGTDRSLGRRVAIKKMRDEIRCDARERARFVTEAKTVAALHHPNIVDIYAIAEDGEDVFLVFEYVDGKTVHDLVQSRGKLEPEQTVKIVKAAADALEFAHGKGVIHRDMKPSNVMIGEDGRVKVMDFGIARVAKDAMTRVSMTNTVVGTPPYMAPEQEQGRVRKEGDVYALAVCAYEMLTGRLPFAGIGGGMLLNKINMSYVAPSKEVAGLPPALDEVFARGFQADPDDRWRTPREFADALAAALPAAARA